MSTQGGLNIVTDGLVFQVDGANKLADNVTNVKNIVTPTETGSFVNGASVVSDAYEFDGVSETIQFGDIENFDGTDTVSICFWIKTTDTSIFNLIGDQEPFGGFRGWQLYCDNGIFGLALANSGTGNIAYNNHTGSVLFSDNVWHNCVVTYGGGNDANNMAFYQDGVLLTPTPSPAFNNLTGSILTTHPLFIGSRGGGDNYFNGSAAFISMYNRVLTQAEITQNYEATKHRFE